MIRKYNIDSGPIHTIVTYADGTVYYSDEFNNRVVALDVGGKVLWQADGFRYPRGLALGRISAGKEIRRCLAICDSWNNRVQFLDTDGHHLCSWRAAGGIGFKEVCDIRFFRIANKERSGYWIVLDRGNHRLCAMGFDGRLLFEIGKAFPPNLESHWRKTDIDVFNDPAPRKIVHDFCVFDPLYYPTKILGRSETSIFLVEPFRNRLKRLLCGSLFPLPLRPPANGEWISAADDVFVAYSKVRQQLSWLDASSKVIYEAPVDGTPVSSDLGTGEVWLHFNDRIELWRFEAIQKYISCQEGGRGRIEALIVAAEVEAASFNSSDVFGNAVDTFRSVFQICEEILNSVRKGSRDAAFFESIQARAISCWRESATSQIHKLWLISLEVWLIAQSGCNPEYLPRLQAMQTQLQSITGPVEDAVTDAVLRRDETMLLYLGLHRSNRNVPATAISALFCLNAFQLSVIKEMLRWCNHQFRHTSLLRFPSESPYRPLETDPPGKWIRRPNAESVHVSRYLREVARIDLLPSGIDDLPRPHAIARTSDSHFYVTLYHRGTLAHLDPEGKRIEEIFLSESGCGTLSNPTGIAADSRDRLWIVEQNPGRVMIYDQRIGESNGDISYAQLPERLFNSVGIGQGPNNSMLAIDYGSHRIITLRENELAEIFIDRTGTGPGEFRFPVSSCACTPDPASGFWIVDRCNHRLQKLDWSGQFIEEIGRCGPGRNSFLLPNYAAQFADGILAVSQSEIDQCLKLVSPGGIELDCLFLDYAPSGILINGERILVAEWNGRCVRVYERIR
jgi:hypothetical protein